jgi:hypothetical protein
MTFLYSDISVRVKMRKVLHHVIPSLPSGVTFEALIGECNKVVWIKMDMSGGECFAKIA